MYQFTTEAMTVEMQEALLVPKLEALGTEPIEPSNHEVKTIQELQAATRETSEAWRLASEARRRGRGPRNRDEEDLEKLHHN
jgi:hypothetical protein